jgi:hypothetical protein
MPARLAEETVAADETATIGEFIAFLQQSSASRPRAPGAPIGRFNQTRAAGCVEAEFAVPADLPAPLRVGLFAQPGTYPARVRFANANSSSDRERDIRGMSIKVRGVPGENLTSGVTDQDFVLNSHPVMMVADARSFLELLRANEAGGLRRILYFLTHPKAAGIARASLQQPTCHLDIPYWSATPYLFGDGRAVKYRMRPAAGQPRSPAPSGSESYLTDALRTRLAAGDAVFELAVQFQADPQRMPIEDASVEWSVEAAPFQSVATLRIPAQRFDSPEQAARCEAMRFSPWHALVPHRPLGGMNRARRAIYDALAAFRSGAGEKSP